MKSVDSGENWSVLDTGLPPDATGLLLLVVSPTTPATVYTEYVHSPSNTAPPPGGHLAKSTDGGVTWNAADAGLSYVDVRAVVMIL